MPVDEIGEVVVDLFGSALTNAGSLVVELTVDHIFSGHTARFFHGVGRRTIAIATLGGKRVPSSLRRVPSGVKPRPRRSDWLALWVGILSWIVLFVVVGFTMAYLF